MRCYWISLLSLHHNTRVLLERHPRGDRFKNLLRNWSSHHLPSFEMAYRQPIVPTSERPYVSSRSLSKNGESSIASMRVSSSSRSVSGWPGPLGVSTLEDDSEVAIAVMGATGTGKTSFINLVSGSSLRVGRGLHSCTALVQTAEPFSVDGRSVIIIDTPGFDDTNKSDADVLKMIAVFLSTAYEHGQKLAGVIYLHRISDFKMGGISTRNFKMFRQLCGDSFLANVVIVTNMWGEVSREIGEAREAELANEDAFFKPALEKGARLLRHDNTLKSAQTIIRSLVGKCPKVLRIQYELVDQHKNLSETAAGEELSRELITLAKRHKEELSKLEEELQEAVQMKDEETLGELEQEKEKLQLEMARVQIDSRKLLDGTDEEKDRLLQRMKEIEIAARRDAEEASSEHRRQIEGLQKRLQDSMKANTLEMAASHKQSTRNPLKQGVLQFLARALWDLCGHDL